MARIPAPVVSPINIFTGTPPPPPAPGGSAAIGSDYGLTNVTLANTAGHGLVAFNGWNASVFPQCPASSVADDAHNYWSHLGTTAPGFATRGSIWIAPNAQPATFVSVGTSLPVAGLTALIAELAALPALAQPGFAAQVASSGSTTSLTVSATAASPVYAFAVAVTGNTTVGVTVPGSPWTPLGSVQVVDPVGAGGPGDTVLTPMWGIFPAGTVSATFTTASLVPMAVCMVAILQTPAAVTAPNPNLPALKLEAAFGTNTGDPTVVPAWTDITSRALTGEGGSIVESSRGRPYELTEPEAGTTTIWLDNHDGAFTPLNGASPYGGSNVRPEVPVRLSATWNNRTYPIAFGRADKWPQEWPDPEFPQWGMSPMQMSDGIGVLANLSLFSAYQSEVLFDAPYTYYPLGETYGEANGLPFANMAVGNVNPLLGVDGQAPGGVTQLSTGETLNMQGDIGTGIGVSGLSSSPGLWTAGAFGVDLGLPQLTNGITVEFWAIVDPATTNTPLVSLLGKSSNYPQSAGQVRFQVAAVNSGTLKTQVLMGDQFGNDFLNAAGAMPNDGLVHHHVFTILFITNFSVTHYLDGVQDNQFTTSGVLNSADINQLVIGPALLFPLGSTPLNYSIGHVAVYPKILNTQRIATHHTVGTGAAGDSVFARFKKIMAWGQSGLAKAADTATPNPAMGVANSLAGQDTNSALHDMMTAEGGTAYADGAGNVWYQSRQTLYNRAPKWTFGDNTANGETPYLPDTNFDYDNAFLYNQTQSQRQIATTEIVTNNSSLGSLIQQFRSEGAAVIDVDTTSEAQYGRRNSLSQSGITNSDQDAYDRAAWSLAKYKQPSFRLPRITLDPISNPTIWPVALGVEQGDVVTVVRRPVGGPVYTVTGVVQMVAHDIGPNRWAVTLAVSPLTIELNVLRLGDGVYGNMSEGIGW